MREELWFIFKSLFKPRRTKVDKPDTVVYDWTRQEYLMFAPLDKVVQFSFDVGVHPSSIVTNTKNISLATWAGYSAQIVKKRVK